MNKIISIFAIIFITGCTTVNVSYPETEEQPTLMEEQEQNNLEDECAQNPSSVICQDANTGCRLKKIYYGDACGMSNEYSSEENCQRWLQGSCNRWYNNECVDYDNEYYFQIEVCEETDPE